MASTPYDYEQFDQDEAPLPPASAFSWPHGVLVFTRMIFHLIVFLAKFLFYVVPTLYIMGQKVTIPTDFLDYVGLIVFCGIGTLESIYSWLHHFRFGKFWSFSLLFYPIYVIIYVVCAIKINQLASLPHYDPSPMFNSGLSNFGFFLIYTQLIFSILLCLLCAIHFFLGRTWALALITLKFVRAKAISAVGQFRQQQQQPGTINDSF